MVNKSRSKSSKIWLDRQHSDPFVLQARKAGFRSRAAYKLLNIQERDKILSKGMVVVDLGAAPGGWSQVAAKAVGETGSVLALDILPMDFLKGVDSIQGDFREIDVMNQLIDKLEGRPVDLVISDMAPNLSGISNVDQARTIELAEYALEFAQQVLRQGGGFLVKVFQGVGFEAYLSTLKQVFGKVAVRKPKASRAESREVYLLAENYISRPNKQEGHDLERYV